MTPAIEKLLVGLITSGGPLIIGYIYTLLPPAYQGLLGQIIAGLGITGLAAASVATTKASTEK